MLQRLAFLLVIIFTLIPVSSVNAHSPIEKRVPDANAVLESIPEKVELFFEDSVEIYSSSIIVRNEKQVEVQIGRPLLDPNNNRHIVIDLQNNLPSGKYIVDVNVVALDGHSFKEQYSFEIKTIISAPEEMFERLKLERTYPDDGTIVQTSPKRIELWFNEPVEISDFAILDDKQQIVPTDKPEADPIDPKHFILELKSELPNGTYAMNSYPRIGDRTKVDVVYFAVKDFTPVGAWII